MRPFVLFLFTFLAYASYWQGRASNPDSLLHCLIGEWKGKGTSFGQPVEDKARFDTVLRARFIFMRLHALKGDDFIAEGYLWHDPKKNVLEFYEFNDGAWPVRILTGKAEGNKIILDEKVDSRHIRITFTISKDSFDLEEARIKDGKEDVFVKETFTRVK